MNKFKYLSKVTCVLAGVIVFLSAFTGADLSAQETISVSLSGNSEVGGKVTVSATVSGAGPYAGFNGSVQYDSKILALDGISSGNYTSKNFQSSGVKFLDYEATIPGGSVLVVATFSCLAVGDTSVTISLDGLGDMNGNDIDVTGSSVSLSVKNPVPKSSEKSLKSLSVSPGTLTPAFAENVYDYTAKVDSSQQKITVSAQVKDAKAKVTLNGVQNKLVAGVNTVKITVTAEDGSTRVYTITVTKADGPTATPTPTVAPLPLVEFGGKTFTILTPGTSDPIPTGFVAATQSYKTSPIPVLVRTFGDAVDAVSLYLVMLADDAGVHFFSYDPKQEAFYPYYEMKLPAMDYSLCTAAPSQMIPKGYESFRYLMEKTEITAYRPISDPESKQILLYLMDADGISDFYLFDTIDGMLIPYRGEVILLDPTPTPTISPTPVTTTPATITDVPASESSPEILIPDITPPAGTITLSQLTNFRDPMILVVYIPIILCLALLIAVITLVIRQRKMSYSDDFEDEEPEEEPKVPEYRPIVFTKSREQRSYEEDTGTYTSFHEPDEADPTDNGPRGQTSRDSYVYETKEGKVVPRVLLGPENHQRTSSRKANSPVLDIPDIHGTSSVGKEELQNKPLRPGSQVPLFGDPVQDTRQRPMFGDPDEG